jgi:SAM-dependent methyltransferase
MQTETDFVLNTYQTISKEFDITRGYVWTCVKDFLNTVEKHSSLLEIGCGNGKNLLYRSDLHSVGIDFVPNFVELCQKRGLSVLQGHALSLPFLDETFENVISIAVFHHLSTQERRENAVNEMLRVLKKGGKGMIVCWAYEQEYNGIKSTANKSLKKGDQYIGWNKNNKRFYYVYDKPEFEEYTSTLKDKRIYWEEGNWICVFTK